MLYHSTRSSAQWVDSAQAVLSGLAPDGGLYMPRNIPALDWGNVLKGTSQEISAAILESLLPDIPDMPRLVARAYTGKFETEDLTPTVAVGDLSVLELFRGPTSAFQDVALSMLPQLLTAAKEEKGVKEDILILTATSGDTGKAALVGFRDVPGVKICVFYPQGGVSQVQRAQMVTQEGSNVAVCAVRGNFDDAQTGVKEIFTAFQDRPLPFRLSSANSINIGRLAPQVMYYFRAYKDLLAAGKIQLGDKVNFSVPTGNFGDILAGYLAGKMGLPVGTLICASNANNVLTDFIRTGTYDRRREFFTTTSPSMDILISSNLERLLFELSGHDDALIRTLMADLRDKGSYTVPALLREKLADLFYGGFCTDEEAAETIRTVFAEKHILCDPHTAVGVKVYGDYRRETGDTTPVVIASTADPYKFSASVLAALGHADDTLDEFEKVEALSRLTGTSAPAPLASLRSKTPRFTQVCDKQDMQAAVRGLLNGSC